MNFFLLNCASEKPNFGTSIAFGFGIEIPPWHSFWKRKSLLISEKRCTVFNFGHKNSGQRFCYETPSAFVHYPVWFVNRLSTVLRLFSASTKFLPTFIQLVFFRVSTRILQNACIFRTALLRCFWAFYHQKAPWNRSFSVTQCDTVVLSVKLVW